MAQMFLELLIRGLKLVAALIFQVVIGGLQLMSGYMYLRT